MPEMSLKQHPLDSGEIAGFDYVIEQWEFVGELERTKLERVEEIIQTWADRDVCHRIE